MQGLYRCPTVVNNVETLANLPHIFTRGVDWFKSTGSNEKNTGPKLYCVSGHVNKPAVIERELGIPLMELINQECGGLRNGHKLKGVIPGGSSVPILRPEECDVRMDFDSLAAKGTLLGSCGVMVIDAAHYEGIRDQRRPRGPASGTPTASQPVELTPGPGEGRGFVPPEVEQRALAVYEEVADVAAI